MYFHIYNPISSWQSSKTNQAHCPVQDVTTKGLPSVSKLCLWQYNLILENPTAFGEHMKTNRKNS